MGAHAFCFRDGKEQLDCLSAVVGFTEHVQSVRNEFVLELMDSLDKRCDAGLGLFGPRRLRLCEVEFRGLCLQDRHKARALGRLVGLQRTPPLQGCLQVNQAAVKSSVRDRRRQIAHKRGRGTALGNGSL
jgi:hypothetical protein